MFPRKKSDERPVGGVNGGGVAAAAPVSSVPPPPALAQSVAGKDSNPAPYVLGGVTFPAADARAAAAAEDGDCYVSGLREDTSLSAGEFGIGVFLWFYILSF